MYGGCNLNLEVGGLLVWWFGVGWFGLNLEIGGLVVWWFGDL